MRIGDFVYFAPGVPFTNVDLRSKLLGELWDRRIDGYYLEPASLCISKGHAFAAGLLLTAAIDSMSRLQYSRERKGQRQVGKEFVRFLTSELPSFREPDVAAMFYENFRNGLTHEARIKNGGEFSWEHECTVDHRAGLLSINPKYLAQEVRDSLTRFVALVTADVTAQYAFASCLKEDFRDELALAELPQPVA